jgi:hypothetical protein
MHITQLSILAELLSVHRLNVELNSKVTLKVQQTMKYFQTKVLSSLTTE